MPSVAPPLVSVPVVPTNGSGSTNLNTVYVSTPFEVPPQKRELLPQPFDDGSAPILLASNDPNFLPGRPLVQSPASGDFIPLAVVPSASRPPIVFDHGFLDDGHGGIDNSKRRAATAADRAHFAWWMTKLAGALQVRPDLVDATRAYAHFMGASGTDLNFSYDEFVVGASDRFLVKADSSGRTVLTSAIQDVSAAAISLHESRGMTADTFTIQSQAIGVGGGNDRYPYPDTENWQKAIGAHAIWLEANVVVTLDGTTQRNFAIVMTLHAEDMYNFNPGAKDIATGIPDNENGVFEITGLAKEFKSVSTLKRKITFSEPLSHVADPTQVPSNRLVAKPR
jgi:hypothetical protein